MKQIRQFLLFVVVLASCSYFMYASYNEVKNAAIDQLNSRQITYANQAAQGIRGFFDHYTMVLKQLAANEHIIALDEQGLELMEFVYRNHPDEIVAVTRVSPNGIILHTLPYRPELIGTDISSQEHIKTILRTHEPVLSDVVGFVQGNQAIAYHMPVFQEGVFQGTIALGLSFKVIAQRYLEGIRIGKEGYAWMISEKGIELYCPVPGHVGHSVFENCRDFPSVISMAEQMIQGRQGVTTYTFDRVGPEKVEPVVKHAVYLPIHLVKTFWSIVVATPDAEVLEAIEGFRNKWSITIVVLLVCGLIWAYYFVKSSLIVKEEARRQEVEQALRRSEALYRAVVEDQTELVERFLPNFTLSFVNAAYCRYFGETAEELIGQDFWQHVPEEDVDHLKRHFESLTPENPVGTVEHRVVNAQGEVRWLQWVDRAIFNERGEVLEYQAVGRDISERKEAEQALQAAHRRLQDIIDFLPDATFVIDREGKVIAWNRAIERMTGVKAEDILGKGDYEYALLFYGVRRPILIDLALEPHEHEKVKDKYLYIETEDESIIAEAFLPSFQGRRTFLWGKAASIYDSDGKIIGAIESIRDVTEKRVAEEKLRESERRFREILETVDLAAVMLDIEGRVTFCNKFLLDLTGWQAQEVLGVIWFDRFIPEEYREELRAVFKELLGSGKQPAHFENDILTRTGDRRRIKWSNTVLRDSDGAIIGTTSIGEDITEREKLEKQLLQSQKMEAIGTMAGGIAHDFNNILAAIIGFTEISLLNLPEASRVRGNLEQVLKAAHRASTLVRQILTFSRHRDPRQPQPENVSQIVEESLKFIRATLPTTIDIQESITPGLHVALSDPTHIHQVIVNLANNAWYAMREDGGRLLVELERVDLENTELLKYPGLDPGPYAKLTVADTGCGMNPDILGRIFDPYFTTKGVGEGSGLGLAVVHGIVKRYRGTVTVRSSPKEGSTFEILLPLLDFREFKVTKTGMQSEIPGGSERILLVDDEKALAEVNKLKLESLGYRVVATTRSRDALAIITERPSEFDLVITDFTMPELTGMDLAEAILKVRPDLPIVLCTGFNESISEAKAKSLGIRAFVMKPFSLADIGAVVRQVLDESA